MGFRAERAHHGGMDRRPDKARLDDDAAKKKTERWLEQFNRTVDSEFFD